MAHRIQVPKGVTVRVYDDDGSVSFVANAGDWIVQAWERDEHGVEHGVILGRVDAKTGDEWTASIT